MARMCYRCMTQTVEGNVCRKCGEPTLSPSGNGAGALAPGTKLCGGRITVGKKIGSGGFGMTYIAFDHRLNRRIAMKEFLPGYLAERQGTTIVPKSNQNGPYMKAMNSFQKEARALYELRGHPNIVHVIGTFRENNTAYYTMEMLEGETLLSYLKRRKKITGEEAFRLLLPIMNAAEYMHQRKILHRDISPDNIMLCQDPSDPKKVIPRLIDFGAAHVAIEGYSLSYPGVKKNGFSPLEQNWDGKCQGPWTDVYSLCATFYSSLVGSVPPAASDRSESDHDPLLPARQVGGQISAEMDAVLMKGLALKYQNRIQSMGELIRRMTAAQAKAKTPNVQTAKPVPVEIYTPYAPSRPVGRRIAAWMLDTLGEAAIAWLAGITFPRSSPYEAYVVIGVVWTAFFLLNWILLMTAKGTLGQLICGLKVKRDDTSESALAPGFSLLYALLYPGIVGLICGIVYLASGKNIGPLESFCRGMVTRRREETFRGMGVSVISVVVPRPETAKPETGRAETSIPRERKLSVTSGAKSDPVKKKPVSENKPRESQPPQPPPQRKQEAPTGPTARLLVRKTTDALKDLQGKAMQIHPGDTLGKSREKAKIVIADPYISGLHCRFLYRDQHGWVVKDENSRNGTYVGEKQLPTGGMAALKNGAMIRTGMETFEFRI